VAAQTAAAQDAPGLSNGQDARPSQYVIKHRDGSYLEHYEFCGPAVNDRFGWARGRIYAQRWNDKDDAKRVADRAGGRVVELLLAVLP
jgi:hypothetical protein